MNTRNHPVDAHEIMAYLDGELAQEPASVAAAHLQDCVECQKLAADLRGVSGMMKKWEVSPSSAVALPTPIANAFQEVAAERTPVPAIVAPWPIRFRYLCQRWAPSFAVCAAVLAVAILGSQTVLNREAKPQKIQAAHLMTDSDSPVPPASLNSVAPSASTRQGISGGVVANDSVSSYLRGGGGSGGDRDSLSVGREMFAQNGEEVSAPKQLDRRQAIGKQATASSPASPMIIRTAALALTSKDFDSARSRVEAMIQKRHGYVGSLNVAANPGAGRTLTASLRIPSNQLTDAVAELKSLGRLDSESQRGEDVTSQYVDLNARLENSRHTEQRLTDLLANRTGKLSDVLSVENELERVRGEIESMEAERKAMTNQVDFATVNLTINEDYRAQLQVVPPSTTTRLVNAAVEGYRGLTDSVLSAALFLFESGPTLLLWLAILFFPARFAWKRLKTT